MKKLTNTADSKVIIPSFRTYKLRQKDTDLIEEDVQVSRKWPVNRNYGPLTAPLQALPLDYRANRLLKRATDVFFAGIVIVFILSWLIPIMALLIKLDSKGPVFFLQRRNKRNGKTFTCIKFRSMFINDEADLIPATENDIRITRVGKFIRYNYLDELPQFFNVLWGDMAIIGPRPHMISENLRYDELIEHYDYRNKVKPGITGLAQVMGYVGSTGGIQEIKDRVNIDTFYIKHWSLKLDITIWYRTMRKILG